MPLQQPLQLNAPAAPAPGPLAAAPRHQHRHQEHRAMDRAARCCAPTECLRVFTANNNGKDSAVVDDLREAVRVICNNDACPYGHYMHRECFDQFEQGVLTYLKSCGRARSWSERQRNQNLWTKKGYDLAYKACGCRCGRGHLRKDLDWVAPAQPINARGADEDLGGGGSKKKKRRNKNARPVLSLTSGGHYNKSDPNNNTGFDIRGRAGSLSSGSTGSSSPPAIGCPGGLQQGAGSTSGTLGAAFGGAMLRRRGLNKTEFFSDR
ncbi:headcase protein-like [Frankliniella occidentalis]|uniref:Headcase protein-like n=1 Tax=Frankliniella occidentalis TaxID=133901 RepID=A0A9C6XT43_FRAOC|nr:headcase protein-like [Frankliniella occidentalis]